MDKLLAREIKKNKLKALKKNHCQNEKGIKKKNGKRVSLQIQHTSKIMYQRKLTKVDEFLEKCIFLKLT